MATISEMIAGGLAGASIVGDRVVFAAPVSLTAVDFERYGMEFAAGAAGSRLYRCYQSLAGNLSGGPLNHIDLDADDLLLQGCRFDGGGDMRASGRSASGGVAVRVYGTRRRTRIVDCDFIGWPRDGIKGVLGPGSRITGNRITSTGLLPLPVNSTGNMTYAAGATYLTNDAVYMPDGDRDPGVYLCLAGPTTTAPVGKTTTAVWQYLGGRPHADQVHISGTTGAVGQAIPVISGNVITRAPGGNIAFDNDHLRLFNDAADPTAWSGLDVYGNVFVSPPGSPVKITVKPLAGRAAVYGNVTLGAPNRLDYDPGSAAVAWGRNTAVATDTGVRTVWPPEDNVPDDPEED